MPAVASAPVVVGIDGSQAAINAAVWAVAEAAQRDVTLRLVYVAPGGAASLATDDSAGLEREFGIAALATVSAAVQATGQHVDVETDVMYGDASAVLIEQSRSAGLVCLGSTGVGVVTGRILGSAALDVAERALCSVVIIRVPHGEALAGPDWIVVSVDDSTTDAGVVDFAMSEASVRQAPVMAVGVWSEDFGETPYDELDRRVEGWRARHPGVRIYAVTDRGTVARFLAEDVVDSVQLAVIGSRDVHQVAHILGPQRPSFIAHGYCSVAIVR